MNRCKKSRETVKKLKSLILPSANPLETVLMYCGSDISKIVASLYFLLRFVFLQRDRFFRRHSTSAVNNGDKDVPYSIHIFRILSAKGFHRYNPQKICVEIFGTDRSPKNTLFGQFPSPPGKIHRRACVGLILMPPTFHIAHLNSYTPNF